MNTLLPLLITLSIMTYVIGGGLLIGGLMKQKRIRASTGLFLTISSIGFLSIVIGLTIGFGWFKCGEGWNAGYISRTERQLCQGWHSSQGWFILGLIFIVAGALVAFSSKISIKRSDKK